MKVIAYIEWCPEDAAKVTAKNNAIQEERKKFPDRYPKRLLLQYGTPIIFNISGRIGQGFGLYEGTDAQLRNLAARWIPEIKWTFKPILTGVTQAYEKLNK
jgi:hypothetical protein